MADDDNMVCAMAAATVADEMPYFSTGLKYVMVDVTRDYLIYIPK